MANKFLLGQECALGQPFIDFIESIKVGSDLNKIEKNFIFFLADSHGKRIKEFSFYGEKSEDYISEILVALKKSYKVDGAWKLAATGIRLKLLDMVRSM